MGEHSVLSAGELAQALRRALPGELAGESEGLARLIAAATAGQGAADEDGAAVQALLTSLAGRSVTTGQSLVSFGEGSNLGDVAVGDVAGGSIIKVTINLSAGAARAGPPQHHSDEETRHRLKLLDIHRRRLRILEAQAASFGSLCPPHITMEIEEIGARIAEIYRALG